MKKFFIILTLLLSFSNLFSLPGVNNSVKDIPGNFAFYRDNTFERESYFGILYYNDSTYSVRYFAPKTNELEEKDFTIYFSLDPSKNHIFFTGEKIVGKNYEREADIINYLHDMFYELSARRQKCENFESTISVKQKYDQFGGNVTLKFNSMIPVFNIESIVSSSNKKLLSMVTQGIISQDYDSFANFKGMPLETSQTKYNVEIDSNLKKEKITVNSKHSQNIKLDQNWTAGAENFYMLGDNAILAFTVIDSNKENQKSYLSQLKRTSLFGNNDAYIYSDQSIIKESKKDTVIENVFFNSNAMTFTKSFHIITPLKDGNIGVMYFSVYLGTYFTNQKYFDDIIKSYSIK